MCVCARNPPLPRQSWLAFVVRASEFGFCLSARQSWLGCWGDCVCVRSLPVPRLSCVACVVWVCVLGFGFWLLPAIPGWYVAVRVLVCPLCLYAANPG